MEPTISNLEEAYAAEIAAYVAYRKACEDDSRYPTKVAAARDAWVASIQERAKYGDNAAIRDMLREKYGKGKGAKR